MELNRETEMSLKEFLEELGISMVCYGDGPELVMRVIVLNKDGDGSFNSEPVEVEFKYLNNEVVIWTRELA